MQREHRDLINTRLLELWPAPLLRARRASHARALADASHVVRRKRDGCYVARLRDGVLHGLAPRWQHEPGLDELRAAVVAMHRSRGSRADTGSVPLHGLRERLQRLGLDDSYAQRTGLPLVAEPRRLRLAGHDRYRRPLWLLAPAARAWRAMQAAARGDSITLDAISGWRSHAYQLGIFERKLARGQSVAQILAVNAAPGYSEHHGGAALDIGTPGEAPAEESFEATEAFAWLQRRAGDFGFALSYPRGNPHGIVYEPWHWCWRAPSSARAAPAAPGPSRFEGRRSSGFL